MTRIHLPRMSGKVALAVLLFVIAFAIAGVAVTWLVSWGMVELDRDRSPANMQD